MTLLEQAARALCIEDGHDPDSDWTSGPGIQLAVAVGDDWQHWKRYRRHARAVLEQVSAYFKDKPGCGYAFAEFRRDFGLEDSGHG